MMDAFSYIDHALTTPLLRERAIAIYQQHVGQALGDKPRNGLRGSDAGACVAAIWSQIHELEAPADWQTQLYSFDLGNMLGSWIGALLKVGWEHLEHDGVGDLEVESAYGGVVSHADIGLGRVDHLGKLRYEYAIECKSTRWTGEYEGPKDYQILQNAQQALGIGSPQFGVITWQIASNKAPRGQTYFETKDFKARVDAELRRQRAALAPEMPIGDPKESWRCRLCRSLACERSPKYQVTVPF
jgi:hypothetical protein